MNFFARICILGLLLGHVCGYALEEAKNENATTAMDGPTTATTDDAVDDADDSFNYDGRIVGGMPASIVNFPYQVSVQYNNAHICGGAIVQANIVITAAHCVEEYWNAGAFKVRAGSSQHKYGGQLLRVRRIIKHERYTAKTLRSDVAIILLAGSFSFTSQVSAVQLAAAQDPLPMRANLYVSGWGVTSEMGSVSSLLRYVAVRWIPQETCARNYEAVVRVTAEMFCAGYANGGKDSCQGDSGGPLISYTRQRVPQLIGIVSFGVGCAQAGYPGVYARVSALRPWIDSTIAVLLQGAA